MSQPLSYIIKSHDMILSDDYFLKGFISSTHLIYRVHGLYPLKIDDTFNVDDFVEEHGIIEDIDELFPVVKFSEMSDGALASMLDDMNLFVINFKSNNNLNQYKITHSREFKAIKNLTNFFIYLYQRAMIL